MNSLLRLKAVRTLQDIRVEKARLHYEALIAEKELTDSFRALGRIYSLANVVGRAAKGIKSAYDLFSGFRARLGRWFGGGRPEDEEGCQMD